MNDNKIPAVKFEILSSTGRGAGAVGDGSTFSTWAEAGRFIRERIAPHAPKGGAYDKVDFRITFADGETYGGRLDVQHPTYSDAHHGDRDLAAHVWGIAQFYAGNRQPDHLSEEDYQHHLRISADQVAYYTELLENYEIPPSDALGDSVGPAIEERICLHCRETFRAEEGDNGALCADCAGKRKREEERRARQAEREADPLWPTFRAGRNEAAKAMRQMLRKRSGKAWSVKGGRGTASGWLTISAPPSRCVGYGYMTPEDCRELAELLGKANPIHDQGVTFPYDERWHYLKAARGDFPSRLHEWEPDPFWHMHVWNSCLDAPRTESELFESYPERDDRGQMMTAITETSLNHTLWAMVRDGEIFRIGDRYTTQKPEGEAETTQEDAPEEAEAGNGRGRGRGRGPNVHGVEHRGSWTWISTDHKPAQSVIDALKALGFRWSARRSKWYTAEIVPVQDVNRAMAQGA